MEKESERDGGRDSWEVKDEGNLNGDSHYLLLKKIGTWGSLGRWRGRVLEREEERHLEVHLFSP